MRLPPLSNRLLACCNFINPGDRIADVGCDHGYLSIRLLMTGVAASAIAADLREGPLQSAKSNAEKFGVRENIAFFLSDGVQSIPRDFDTLVCAGMGGDTIISILEAAPWLRQDQYRLILQCQSRRPDLRKYLYDHGYRITRETLAKDGHFIYPVMEVCYDPAQPLSPGSCHISPALLHSGSELLPEFYEMVINGIRSTVAGLSRAGGEKLTHYEAVLKELTELEDTVYGNR